MRARRALSLIETIVAVALLSVVITVCSFYIFAVFDISQFMSNQKDLAQNCRSALYTMVREIRRLQASNDILIWEGDRLSFKNIENQTVTFAQSGGDLLKNDEVLVDNLVSPGGLTLSYWDKDGNNAASLEAVKLIKFRISAQLNSNQFVIESAVGLRPGS